MRDLKLSEWANVAEIFASIVIIASLMYVGVELNQNTQALRNDSYQYVLALLSDQQIALVSNDELHRIVKAAENTPSEVSEEEWSRFTEFMFPRIGVWEYLYVANQEGSISDTVWEGFDPYFLSIICRPGYGRWIKENSTAFAPVFYEYLQTSALQTCEN